jgi:signal transduction histidine kinase
MSTPNPDPIDERILVVAPTGRDAGRVAGALREASLLPDVCAGVDELARKLEAGAGTALVAEEILVPGAMWTIAEAIRRQPPWSDIPLIVLTSPGDASRASLDVLALVEPLGNVTLLERPVRVATLLSAVYSALRARRRQYEVRDHLAERARAEAEREALLTSERAARAEVEAANRATDEFLAVLSHELRTPLQPILGWVRLLRQARLDEDGTARALETIERSTRAQSRLIEDLLDISRVVTGTLAVERAPVNLVTVAATAVDTVRGAAEAKSVALEMTTERSCIEVVGDTSRLEQVIWNLLANAIAFTPAGGAVDVGVTVENGKAVIAVGDTGAGIPAHFLPRIFARFGQADSTTTRRHGGLGLGLAIVRHVVECHGGRVTAESPGLGRGATFTVRLPLRSASAATAADAGARAPPSLTSTDAACYASLHSIDAASRGLPA